MHSSEKADLLIRLHYLCAKYPASVRWEFPILPSVTESPPLLVFRVKVAKQTNNADKASLLAVYDG